tara:strand:- start:640 stop:2547 length:1908 start_codon:yes stop_codon:yes gene_type:complete
MSVLDKLTEGIVSRDLAKEGQALINKWEATGLLEGLDAENAKNGMALLLENQAKELLREYNSMQSGEVSGFAAVAFPIVRRVFGGLIANELVSVQPMSLPSGLIFFLDFKHADDLDEASGDKVIEADDNRSLYGDRVARGITSGVRLSGIDTAGTVNLDQADKGFYNLNSGYSAARGEAGLTEAQVKLLVDAVPLATIPATTAGDLMKKAIRHDADLIGLAGYKALVHRIPTAQIIDSQSTDSAPFDARNDWSLRAENDLSSLTVSMGNDGQTVMNAAKFGILVRRLTRVVEGEGVHTASGVDAVGTKYLEFVSVSSGSLDGSYDAAGDNISALSATSGITIRFPISDGLAADSSSLGALAGTAPWGLESRNGSGQFRPDSNAMREINIRVDSLAITARTRKLKASWSPELGQDLNAYHNLDAEVELTSILSEQIGLEIDQEILRDLVMGATAGTLYWSRRPGLFVNRSTGADITSATAPPDFTGTVSEWYETLVETINDVSADIHRKTLRGGANFLVCSPEVANILEFTSGFRASITADDDRGTVGAQQSGSINKKWDVYVDPYFPRNVILVGRKGSSFLESGYVYAPYVPLQVTPTIFNADDFTPRKGVMTRYGKKMVRPDLYGLVVVRDLEG